jgi:hypothetical protein
MWTDAARAGLIDRISERLSEAAGRPRTISAAEVEQIESELGFPLPPFLRRLYLHVGDGGFGPGLDVAIPGYPAGCYGPSIARPMRTRPA